jgi:hypothetical protein
MSNRALTCTRVATPGQHRPKACACVTFTAAAAIAGATHADVYKCAGNGSAPIYQEMPCAPGKELRNFQTDPPEITVLPGSPKGNGFAAPGDRASRDGKAAKAARNGKPEKPKGDAAERKHAHTGMTEGEVLIKLGAPDVTSGRKNQKQARWTWLPAEGDTDTVTTLTLVDGVVTNVERKLVRK